MCVGTLIVGNAIRMIHMSEFNICSDVPKKMFGFRKILLRTPQYTHFLFEFRRRKHSAIIHKASPCHIHTSDREALGRDCCCIQSTQHSRCCCVSFHIRSHTTRTTNNTITLYSSSLVLYINPAWIRNLFQNMAFYLRQEKKNI